MSNENKSENAAETTEGPGGSLMFTWLKKNGVPFVFIALTVWAAVWSMTSSLVIVKNNQTVIVEEFLSHNILYFTSTRYRPLRTIIGRWSQSINIREKISIVFKDGELATIALSVWTRIEPDQALKLSAEHGYFDEEAYIADVILPAFIALANKSSVVMTSNESYTKRRHELVTKIICRVRKVLQEQNLAWRQIEVESIKYKNLEMAYPKVDCD